MSEHSSTPNRSLNDGRPNESADADIFFEMDGLDGNDAPAIGGRYARSNQQRALDADGYDDCEEEDTYG